MDGEKDSAGVTGTVLLGGLNRDEYTGDLHTMAIPALDGMDYVLLVDSEISSNHLRCPRNIHLRHLSCSSRRRHLIRLAALIRLWWGQLELQYCLQHETM